MLVISLSSIPPRFDSLGPALEALVSQDVPVDHVILYIPKVYRRFPDYDGELPAVPAGVEIRQPDEDYGPASKVLHAVRDFADTPETDILFCDDDLIYQPDWARQFVTARKERPEEALCSSGWDLSFLGMASAANADQPHFAPQSRTFDLNYRWRKVRTQITRRRWHLERQEKPWRNLIRKSGFMDTFEGLGGVMVKPRFFDAEVFDIPDVLWAVDDIWLSGMTTKNGHRPWAVAQASRFTYTTTREVDALNTSVIDGADRHAANRACARYMKNKYHIWGGPDAEQANRSAA